MVEAQCGCEKNFRTFWQGLSPQRKAGFLLWPSLAGTDFLPEEREVFRRFQPSGMILFRRNFSSMAQARRLVEAMNGDARTVERPFPLQVSMDEEGGRVSRLPPPYPRGRSAIELADTNSPEEIESQAVLQACAGLGLGIRVILAPVADVLTEPSNPVLGDRCWGRTPEVASQNGLLVWETFRRMGIVGCAKHFPGHGNTCSDSHKGFARSDADLATLREREWRPFRDLIAAGIPMVMTAHVLVPALDAERPATLSPKILQDHLRGELGFRGIIVSDDLRMNAVAHHYGVTKKQDSSITESLRAGASRENNDEYLRQASVDALLAGCDLLLSCQSIVREEIVLETLADKMAREKGFDDLCFEKAWRTVRHLGSSDCRC